MGKMQAEAAPMSVASSSSTTEPTAAPKEIFQDMVEEWVHTLDREGKKGLAMLSCPTLVNELSRTERKQNDEAKRKGSWNHGY